MNVVRGRAFAPNATGEIMLGWRAADNLNKTVGDSIDVDGNRYTVVGLFSVKQAFADSGSMLPLTTLQAHERKPGDVTLAFVRLAPGANSAAQRDAIRQQIQHDNPVLTTVRLETDFGRVDRNLQLISAVDTGATILALAIGAIIVMNTMLLSFFERTREFGVLRAVGWTRLRVVALVVGEALLISVFGAAVGVGLGVRRRRAPSSGFRRSPACCIPSTDRACSSRRCGSPPASGSSAPSTRASGRQCSGRWRRCVVSDPIIVLRDVHKGFDHDVVKALDGLDLEVRPGEFIAITGRSGAGKSTLLHLLAALDTPDRGTIEVLGHDLAHLHRADHYRRNEVGSRVPAPQPAGATRRPPQRGDADVRDPSATTRPPRARDGTAGRRRPRGEGAPAPSRAVRRRTPAGRDRQGSGQRARVLLADEPTGSLDTAAVQNILELFHRLHGEREITIVMVTHDPVVANTADLASSRYATVA